MEVQATFCFIMTQLPSSLLSREPRVITAAVNHDSGRATFWRGRQGSTLAGPREKAGQAKERGLRMEPQRGDKEEGVQTKRENEKHAPPAVT